MFCLLLHEQKERPGGEPYRPSPSGDFAPPLGDYNLDLKILLLLFFTEKERPRQVGVPAVTHRRLRDAEGDYKLALNKILLPTFYHRKVPPAGQAYSLCLCTRPRRQAPTNPPLIRTTNPSFCFPIKPTIYAILAQYLPKM